MIQNKRILNINFFDKNGNFIRFLIHSEMEF